MECSSSSIDAPAVRVEREMELAFKASDFTWLVFTSQPIMVKCILDPSTNTAGVPDDSMNGVQLKVVGPAGSNNGPLVLRVAVSKFCTSGLSPVYCQQEQMHPTALNVGQGEYSAILRRHAWTYPGPSTSFSYQVGEKIQMTFDWDTKVMRSDQSMGGLITFALPHHFDLLPQVSMFDGQLYCTPSLVGPACLVVGSTWSLVEDIPTVGLRAPRHPAPEYMPALIQSLKVDLNYTVQQNYLEGAGDTYFSGKMLAKLGRIIAIADEVNELCQTSSSSYQSVCRSTELPTKDEINGAVVSLKAAVEIWLDGKGQSPFVYDSSCK